VNISGPELFDNFEINNSTGFSRLVNLEASTANTWLSSYVLPLIYPGTYPYEGLTIQTRIPGDVNVLGAPPVRAISISQQPANVKLDMNDPYTVTPLNGTGAAVYNLPLISYRDFIELRGKAAASGNTKNPWFVKLIESAYTGILSGNYDFKMKYTLPGTNRVTSEKLVTIVID
jgi:hypothetical protein